MKSAVDLCCMMRAVSTTRYLPLPRQFIGSDKIMLLRMWGCVKHITSWSSEGLTQIASTSVCSGRRGGKNKRRGVPPLHKIAATSHNWQENCCLFIWHVCVDMGALCLQTYPWLLCCWVGADRTHESFKMHAMAIMLLIKTLILLLVRLLKRWYERTGDKMITDWDEVDILLNDKAHGEFNHNTHY